MVVVREGYKITELGEIPVEWKIYILEDLTSKIGDGIHATPKYDDNGTIAFINGNNIKGNELYIPIDNKKISESEYRKYKQYINETSILISINGTIGNVGYYSGEKVLLGKSIAYINPIESLNRKFLFYILSSNQIQSYFNKELTGSTIKNLSLKTIRSTLISLPPLREQQKIASILSTVDEQIDDTVQLIEKTKVLKKGLMQQLLTNGIGHTEFKQTELGEIPVAWRIYPLKEIGTFSKGKGIAKKDLSVNGHPCILYGQLYTKYKERIDKIISFTEVEIKNPIVGMKNDLLIPSSGETAIDIATASSLNVDNIYIGGDINLFRPHLKVDSNYLSYQINSVRKRELAKLAQGSSVYHLYASSLEDFKVAIPSLEEQQKIASILSTVDEQIETYEQQRQIYEGLKKGLMQQLLTGKVRVKI